MTAASSSRPMPRSTGSAPASATSASSIGRFESRICPGASSTGPSRSSSPVEITPTRARGYAGTSVEAERAEHAEVRRTEHGARRRTPRRPRRGRRRRRARGQPRLDRQRDRAHRRHRRAAVRSTITIASAPSGIGAPVMIRIASPGADRDRRARGRPGGRPPRAGATGVGVGRARRCRRPAPRTRPSRCSRTAAPARRRRCRPRARARARRARRRSSPAARGTASRMRAWTASSVSTPELRSTRRAAGARSDDAAAAQGVEQELLGLGSEVVAVERELDVGPEEVDLLADVEPAVGERPGRRPSGPG